MRRLNHFSGISELLACWYHQDTWLEFEKDEQVWAAAFEGEDKDVLQTLQQEAENLMKLGPEVSQKFIQENAESLYTADPMESLAWIKRLSEWLVRKGAA